jgi:hypothetical protein
MLLSQSDDFKKYVEKNANDESLGEMVRRYQDYVREASEHEVQSSLAWSIDLAGRWMEFF